MICSSCICVRCVTCEVTNIFILRTTDVDTDLYKLIMSPQYLTTEHIQVSRSVECDCLTELMATHLTLILHTITI